MYYHLVTNVQRNGESGYLLVRTYKRWSMMEKYLVKTGGVAHWIVGSKNECLRADAFAMEFSYNLGGFTAQYWNSGGYHIGVIPKLRLFSK
jgi:hypothetical protein